MHRQQAAIVRCSGVGIPSLAPRRTTAPLRASTSRRRPSSRFRAIDDRHCGGSTAACFDGMIHRIRRKRDLPRARDGDLFAGGGLKHAPSTSARSGPIPERARALTPPILAIERNLRARCPSRPGGRWCRRRTRGRIVAPDPSGPTELAETVPPSLAVRTTSPRAGELERNIDCGG